MVGTFYHSALVGTKQTTDYTHPPTPRLLCISSYKSDHRAGEGTGIRREDEAEMERLIGWEESRLSGQ